MAEDPLKGRCGSCSRFARVVETVDANGEVRRSGQCLLGVWPSPLYETSTCAHHVERGTLRAQLDAAAARPRHTLPTRRGPTGVTGAPASSTNAPRTSLPEDLLAMDADEFRSVLRSVLRDELGVARGIDLGGRWQGGELVLIPGKEGTAEKRVPLDVFFNKVVMIRDKLRVLEQKINGNEKLTAEEKVQMQQYITQCYGSLTTFNILFADAKEDGF